MVEQDKTRSRALVVEDKTERVRNCHRSMLHALAELTAAAGLKHPQEFHPEHVSRWVAEREAMTLGEHYPTPIPGGLLTGVSIRPFASSGVWRAATVLLVAM
jgi:hypothetical protein